MRYTWLVIVFFSFACTEEQKKEVELDWSKDQSTELNREIAIQESIDIQLFLELHKDWKMEKTGSGLQYFIYEEGTEEPDYHPNEGDVAEIEYEISLLDGTICYQTESDEFERFVVDNSEIESGVQEGIKKMSVGDRAKLIIPSHLGHGLMGDLEKIPPLNTLVVDIHLLGIRKK